MIPATLASPSTRPSAAATIAAVVSAAATSPVTVTTFEITQFGSKIRQPLLHNVRGNDPRTFVRQAGGGGQPDPGARSRHDDCLPRKAGRVRGWLHGLLLGVWAPAGARLWVTGSALKTGLHKRLRSPSGAREPGALLA